MDWSTESAALRALRIGLLMQETAPDRLPAYQDWLDQELTAQPARLAAAGLPVLLVDPPEPAPVRVLACYELACSWCGATFTRTGSNDKRCPGCRVEAHRAYDRAYNQTVRKPRVLARRAP